MHHRYSSSTGGEYFLVILFVANKFTSKLLNIWITIKMSANNWAMLRFSSLQFISFVERWMNRSIFSKKLNEILMSNMLTRISFINWQNLVLQTFSFHVYIWVILESIWKSWEISLKMKTMFYRRFEELFLFQLSFRLR